MFFDKKPVSKDTGRKRWRRFSCPPNSSCRKRCIRRCDFGLLRPANRPHIGQRYGTVRRQSRQRFPSPSRCTGLYHSYRSKQLFHRNAAQPYARLQPPTLSSFAQVFPFVLTVLSLKTTKVEPFAASPATTFVYSATSVRPFSGYPEATTVPLFFRPRI